ncbi:MAG: TRAP transporter fused permease subunit, partial [Rhodospirillales bacterium]
MSEHLRRRAARICATSLSLFQLIVPVWLPLYDMQLRSLHVMLVVAAILLIAPMFGERRTGISLVLDTLLILVSAAANLIIFLEWQDIVTYTSSADILELSLGALLLITVLDAARRGAGWAIPVCVMLIFAYVFVGPWMPGIWTHPGFPLTYVIESLYFSTSGLYGSLTGTSATFISIFILFGALLQATGGGQTFMDLALLIAGRATGGPAKVGVVASALFGMISGSAVANVSVTGNYTIPLMRRLGYERNFAAGVEAMSSTGGGITPPVMGITAFIMADLLNIPYLEVIGYAAIPCLLFYVGILAGIHFKARDAGLLPVPVSELPHARDVLTWSR